MTEAEYHHKMQDALLHQQEQLKLSEEQQIFLDRYWPVDPFNGSWVRSENCPSEVIARAFYAQEQINRGSGFKPSHSAVQSLSSPLAGPPLIRVDSKWLNIRRTHGLLMCKLAKALASGSPDEEVGKIYQGCVDDEQLYQLLEEVSEEFERLIETSTANCECCDDQMGRDECF